MTNKARENLLLFLLQHGSTEKYRRYLSYRSSYAICHSLVPVRPISQPVPSRQTENEQSKPGPIYPTLGSCV